jgi:hypothetical protein
LERAVADISHCLEEGNCFPLQFLGLHEFAAKTMLTQSDLLLLPLDLNDMVEAEQLERKCHCH